MSATCTSEPISWLELERFALGELPAGPATRVERHLSACPLCAGCLGQIRSGDPGLVLPALPAAAAQAVPGRTRRPRLHASRRWPIVGLGAALAGVAALLVLAWPALDRGSGTATKGIDVALTLVRERQGTMAEDPPDYHPDDRWKALATCPAGRELAWALVLFQEGAPATPMGSGTKLACGNRVPLPGAFRLTGTGRAAVCFLGHAGLENVGPEENIGSTSASEVAAAGPTDLEHAGAACVRLSSPAPSRRPTDLQ